MYSSTKLLHRSDIYLLKKSKQPDHLLDLLSKFKSPDDTENVPDEEEKERIRKKMIQKRIDAIIKTTTVKPSVSDPVPYVKKKWVSPLEQQKQNIECPSIGKEEAVKEVAVRADREEVQQVLRVLDINKRLRYFGEYLQVQSDETMKMSVAHNKDHETRMAYLTRKFHQLQRGVKPRLFIFNYPLHERVTFVNYLQNDEFFQNIMRKEDPQLVKMLIETLMTNGSFTLTSFMHFYNIFVWQSADKKEQVEFVVKLLMKDSIERPLADISKVIDTVCRKIHLENFNKSLENFNEVMKKLMFGDDYEYSNRKEYYLTRKALIESLHSNEQCISIFINIFYAS